MTYSKPVLGFAAFSGTGKTTLLTQLIPLLADRGVQVGVIKHAHHNFDIDKPGKDSYELRKAGARQMLVASRKRWALMTETDDSDDPQLDDLIGRLDLEKVDLVLVEGFKHVPFTRIELHRPSLGHPLLYPEDNNIIAVATDSPIDTGGLPRLDLNDVGAIVEFVMNWTNEQARI
ncbi:MAG: molybdopterin-guanine dinucleotide biosynthesis protein MobB [Gammaproteobacteria bacterium]|nr:molybdopterin-guanine dinucleotide biosynthesis protein MobB [Gammaproteobacteria bacterium]